jgi:hypothetical protein
LVDLGRAQSDARDDLKTCAVGERADPQAEGALKETGHLAETLEFGGLAVLLSTVAALRAK